VLSQESKLNIQQAAKVQAINISEKQIEIVLSGMSLPIRQMDEKKQTELLVQALYYVASVYCGVNWDNTNEIILTACAEEVTRNFGMLGIDEIREAFSLASMGTFEAEMTAWRGVFTVSIVLRVLNGYKAYRNKIQKAILVELEKENELERIEIDKQKAERVKKEIEQEFLNAKEQAGGLKPIYTNWKAIPHYWAKSLIEDGIIDISPERKKEIFKEAQKESKIELIELSQQAPSEWKRGEAKAIVKAIDSMKAENTPDEFIFRCNNNYSRLLIWEIINPRKQNNFHESEKDDKPF